jgi:hypothetical protein
VNDLKTRDVVICALKMEAKQNPKKKLIIGQKVITYRELAAKLIIKYEKKEKLPRQEDKIINNFVNSSIEMFNSNPIFRTKMLELASPAIS